MTDFTLWCWNSHGSYFKLQSCISLIAPSFRNMLMGNLTLIYTVYASKSLTFSTSIVGFTLFLAFKTGQDHVIQSRRDLMAYLLSFFRNDIIAKG